MKKNDDDGFTTFGIQLSQEVFYPKIIITYFVLLGLLIHNIIQYLVRQRKYKQLHMCLFYSIASIAVMTRIFVAFNVHY